MDEVRPVDKKKINKKDKINNTVDVNPELVEINSSTKATGVVFTYGRMNPPTKGHEKLVDRVEAIAKSHRYTPEVHLTKSHDAKRNPMPYKDKILTAREAFGGVVKDTPATNLIQLLKELGSKYDNAVMVVGQDRLAEFSEVVKKYNKKEYDFGSITVVTAGLRDPDSDDDATSISASKMRQFVVSGDLENFKKGLPVKIASHAQDIFDIIRYSMKLNEEIHLDEFVLSIPQRRARGMLMRRFKTKLMAARKRMMNRMAPADKLLKRSRKAAIKLIRKKVAGEKGIHYADLSASEKMMIDKRVDQRKSTIAKIARRMLPGVRKAEIERLRKLHQPAPEHQTEDLNKSFETLIESLSVPSIDTIDELWYADDKVMLALHEKASISGLSFNTLYETFKDNNTVSKSHLTEEQLGFNRVNSFIAKHILGEMSNEERLKATAKDKIKTNGDKTSAALAYMSKLVKDDVKNKHSIADHAVTTTMSFNVGLTARQLVAKYNDLNESVATCDLVGREQIASFEKFVDRMFEKFNIDFDFTNHFSDRMSDTRNTPCISLKELADLITKIYKKAGKPLQAKAGSEVVIKDLQKDLNMPVAIEYDRKADEIKVVAKTIMRKKDFKSPDQVIKY